MPRRTRALALGRRAPSAQSAAGQSPASLPIVISTSANRRQTSLDRRHDLAVQTSEDGRPRRIKLRRIARFKRKRVKSIAKKIIGEGATVVTDGLTCFRGVADAGCKHVPMATGSGRRAARHPAFKWVNTMLGN